MKEQEVDQMCKDVKKALAKSGTPALINTDFCKSWLWNHGKNCSGCSSEAGCKKYTEFLGACSGGRRIAPDFFDGN